MNMKDRQTISTQIGVVCHQKKLLDKLDDVEFIEKEFSKGFHSSYVQSFSSRVANLPGTRPYWYYNTQNLIASMDEYGAPTIFFSISAADYHWIDLQRFMPHPPGTDLKKLTLKERKKMVVENPHIATWFFSTKMRIIMDRLIPILGIKHYWFRVESQGRGSDHIHGCFWFEDAPNLCVLSNEIKLGFIASKKLDTIHGENENTLGDKHKTDSKVLFQDKKPMISRLFSADRINQSNLLMEEIKIKFLQALDRDIIEQQNAKYNDTLSFFLVFLFFSFSNMFFHFLLCVIDCILECDQKNLTTKTIKQ